MRREFGGRSSGDSKSGSKRSQEATTDASLSPYHSHEDLSSLATKDDDETIEMYNVWLEGLSSNTAAGRERGLLHIQEEILRMNPSFLLFAADHLITILDQSLKLFLDVKMGHQLRQKALRAVVQTVLVCGDDAPELYDRAARSLVSEFLLHPTHQPGKMKKSAAALQEELLAQAWAALSVLYAANERLVVDDQPLSAVLLASECSPLQSLLSNTGKGSQPAGVSKHTAAAALTAAQCIDISQRRVLKASLLTALQLGPSTSSQGTSPVTQEEPTVMSPTSAAAALESASDGDSIPAVSIMCYLWNAVGVLEDRFHGSFNSDDESLKLVTQLAALPTPDKPLKQMQRAVMDQLGVPEEQSIVSEGVVEKGSVAPSTKIQFRDRHVDVIGFARIYAYDVCRYYLGSMLLVHCAKNPTVRRILHVQGDVTSKLSKEEMELGRQALQERLDEKEEVLKARAKDRKSKMNHRVGGDDDD